MLCAAIQDKIISASFVTNSLEPGADCQEYQESCLAIKIGGDSIYMLGKDRVRVFHMVLGRVANEVDLYPV